jgi:hypothetical protein
VALGSAPLGSDMRTHVTFHSNAFNRTEQKENFINPSCFGEDLARWVIPRFTDTHLKVDPEPCQEDWGWEVFVTCDGKGFFIGIGPYELDSELGWLCFVESRSPFYKKWVGATDASEQQRVCVAFHSVLASAPEIRDIRWHTKENFTTGNEAAWKAEPGA